MTGWDHERTLLWNDWLGTADGKQYEAGWGDNENRERARRGESWVEGRVAERRANEAEVARLRAENGRLAEQLQAEFRLRAERPGSGSGGYPFDPFF